MGKIHDFFFFTASERRGVCVLLVLVAILTALRVVLARAADDLPTPQEVPGADSLRKMSEASSFPLFAQASSGPAVAKPYHKYVAPVLRIELNTADTLLLTELRGIGPGYARRIVGYRERLGGFHRPEQLLEVYGFTDELYAKIEASVWVDPVHVTPIRVNHLGIAQLKRHPYISYYEAKSLYETRMLRPDHCLHGWSDLDGAPDLDAAFRERLEPYLSFEE